MPTHIANFPEIPGESQPEHIGDGVYVTHDGYHIWLRVQRGTEWESIALEPDVFDALVKYRDSIKQ